ncbi:hypothetical protein HPB47_022435 [Ixodes persulcatus]|uniref:Uncharacterized protein n=1 Tax=Ixodes persulcatus TaxID=34615 RepID=A0AC60QA54_IXOPE|nr:hypothetical protein HPB47_022435 [Ixodes persulcatus]
MGILLPTKCSVFRTLTSALSTELECSVWVCVQNADKRGNRWSNQTVQKTLQVRLTCGSRGYKLLKDEVLPLPSERTLQRRIEVVKFEPDITPSRWMRCRLLLGWILTQQLWEPRVKDEAEGTLELDMNIGAGLPGLAHGEPRSGPRARSGARPVETASPGHMTWATTIPGVVPQRDSGIDSPGQPAYAALAWERRSAGLDTDSNCKL